MDVSFGPVLYGKQHCTDGLQGPIGIPIVSRHRAEHYVLKKDIFTVERLRATSVPTLDNISSSACLHGINFLSDVGKLGFSLPQMLLKIADLFSHKAQILPQAI